jgi:hypothetical protein
VNNTVQIAVLFVAVGILLAGIGVFGWGLATLRRS